MRKRWIGSLVLLGLLLGPACSQVHEPWVPSADYAKQERYRSPELHNQLQIRLSENLRDR
jgi:hypothetical protein